MFKFVVIYYRVDDENALEEFYSGTHLRLLEQLPGVLKLDVGRIIGQPTGPSRFHLIVEASFLNEAAWRAAQLSEPGIQLMNALRPWAEERLIAWFYTNSFTADGRSG